MKKKIIPRRLSLFLILSCALLASFVVSQGTGGYDVVASNPVLIPSSICGPGGQWTGCGPSTFAGLIMSLNDSKVGNNVTAVVETIMNLTNWNNVTGGGAGIVNLTNASSYILTNGPMY
tara:strand:+ start:16962 stop:17318 length:357 start_codon:yes stop_codon:yes gene_type:complete